MKARVKKMWEGTIGKYVQPPPWCIYDMLLWCGTKSLTVEVQNSSSVLYFPHSEIPLNCVSRTVFGVSKATRSLALAHVTSESSVSSPDYHTARDSPGLHQRRPYSVVVTPEKVTSLFTTSVVGISPGLSALSGCFNFHSSGRQATA